MGIVAVGAEIVGSLARTCKVSYPFSMNTGLPVFIHGTMALTAEPIAFGEVYKLPIVKMQLISILCIMAIETPSHRFGVMELDIGVFFFKFSLLSIHLHGGMTIAAGEYPFSNWQRRNWELFTCFHGRGDKTDPY
jgi:hypothetical protein